MESSRNDHHNRKSDALIDKYERYFKTAKGGMFHKKTAKKLIGFLKTSGRNQTTNDFWYDRRNDVRTALVEQCLFLDVAPQSSIEQVITIESIKPLIYSLFWGKDWILLDREANTENAKIAQYMIEAGFHYLTEYQMDRLTKSHQSTVEDAIDLSRFLLSGFPDTEEYRSTWMEEERDS